MPGRSKFLPNWTDFLGRFSSSIPHWLVCLARVNAYHCHKSPLRCTRAVPQGHPAESHPKAGPFIEQLFNKYGLNERGPPHTHTHGFKVEPSPARLPRRTPPSNTHAQVWETLCFLHRQEIALPRMPTSTGEPGKDKLPPHARLTQPSATKHKPAGRRCPPPFP